MATPPPGSATGSGSPSTAAPAPSTHTPDRASGDWTVQAQDTVLNQAEGRIAYRFHARDLHLVMGPAGEGLPCGSTCVSTGSPRGAAHRTDVDDQGNGTATEPRLYQLIRQPGPVSERTIEITFLDPGVHAYAFTFG
ncbi:MAG TPA: hypothetical protein VG409_11575 [Actinomycetota bacterium]|nr:hypothetical protein [Actinomycetota bacterium]